MIINILMNVRLGMRFKRETDLLHGSISDKMIRFVFPLAATGILQQLFNAADGAIM